MSSVNVVARGAVEHDDACRPLQAGEEVVLAALVVVEAADHAAARERDVRLHRGPRQDAVAAELAEPAALVLEPPQRDPLDPLDAHLFTPVSSIVPADLGEVLPVLAGVLPPAPHR